jgi:SMC interacting uncharacterized protein involved in chromosome segregation
VAADPRVSVGQQDYAAQFKLARGLAEALDASSAKSQEIKSLRAQIKTLHAAQFQARAKELDEHFGSLMDHGTNATAMRGLERVNGEIQSLYTQVLEADAAPTRAQQKAAESLLTEWQSLSGAAAEISGDDLMPLNKALKRAKLPVLRSDAAAPEEGESSDEE